ncbi:MAG: cytochrome c biogenesis protein CcsA [Dehalococcoidia bacterium]|nr:cytochrome c biogenesis protein CcsA [Dehalococcoidia bacterium]
MSVLGNVVLILACVVAVYSVASALLDSRDNKYGFPKTARIGVFVVACLLTLAEMLLLIAFYTHDFSLAQVANYSSLDTPPVYLLTGLWAGNAGALLFWAWIVALSGAIVLWRSNDSNKALMPNTISAILFVEIFFLVLLFIEAPFRAAESMLADGFGLNLALQTPLMIFHPPALLAGYALTTVPFALAIAALFNRRVDDTWVLNARRWLIAAWVLLGLGNILGMWWAYASLGWGGYWAWDPVENSGLMPWLLLTALLHSNVIYLKRGIYKVWTVVLAIASFWLVILGAFVTRFVPISVHAFAPSGTGWVFIIFLLFVLAGAIYLFIDRRDYLSSATNNDTLVSANNTFALFNWIIVVATIIILAGTLLPFITKTTTDQKYFNIFNLPVFIIIILLSGVCVFMGWGRPNLNKLTRQLLWPLLGGLIAVILAVVCGWTRWYVLLPLFVLGVTVVATLYKWGRDVLSRMRGCHENAFVAFWRLLVINRSRYGGYIAHIAIVVMALGIIGSSAYGYSSDKRMHVNVGESITLSDYTLTYNGLHFDYGNSAYEMWCTVVAEFDLEYNNVAAGSMYPTRTHNIGEAIDYNISSDVAIRSNPLRDLYIVFDDFENYYETSPVYITVMVKPLVQWIWIGGLLLLLGGALSFSASSRRSSGNED